MSLATKPRDEFRIRLRRGAHLVFLASRAILRALRGQKPRAIRHAVCYPIVADAERLADLANRVSWYLPSADFCKVDVRIPGQRALLEVDIASLRAPGSQGSYLEKSENVQLVDRSRVDLAGAERVLVWSKWSLLNPRVLLRLGKVEMVDPTFYSGIEAATFRRLCMQAVDRGDRERFASLSRDNFERMLSGVRGYETGYVFGTGPSLEDAFAFDYDGGLRVVCNSIVKNKALLEHIRPHLLVFGDAVFHYSPCRYAAEFRKMMLDVVDEFQCYVLIQDFGVPLFLAHYPQLKDRIIGLPVRGEEYNFPTLDRFHVRPSQNVMTRCMLPVASSVAEEIFIIGADGRRPDEKYFWTHSSAAQFDDLMQTAVDTHPSFFRDTVYTDYYERHCRILEELFRYGEAMGKSYYALTPSYVPALARRPAPGRS